MQTKKNDITLYGAGGHCKVVIDILTTCGNTVNLVVDDSPESQDILGIPVTQPSGEYDQAIVTIGNCRIRKAIVSKIHVNRYLTAIHPSAIVASTSTVGEGTVIVHGAIVQACASIGRHCIINTKASVGHDVVLDDFVHVASGATVCGGVNVGECTWIGAGSVVKQGVKIGKNCMIGAGSVVVNDIPDNSVAFGNPCRVVKPNL